VKALKTIGRVLAVTCGALPLAAVAVSGLSASAAGNAVGAAGYRIVVQNDRDGESRTYSVRQDGSRLAPLFPRGRALEPLAVSRDGSTIAYRKGLSASTPIYASRADGTHLRRLVRDSGYGAQAALSRNGRRLAFTKNGKISIVGSDGRGLRRVTSGPDSDPNWSPDGRTLVFTHNGKIAAVVVQPLNGRAHIAARGRTSLPAWSPDGRWIAYIDYEGALNRRNGLYVVQPNGKDRHRVARDATTFAWSPDGRRLALTDAGNNVPPRVAVVGRDGRGLTWLHLGVVPGALTWSPDGRRLLLAAHAGDDPDQIWLVGGDGRGLRRLTSAGTNSLLGWTRLAPVLPVAPSLPPSERVLAGGTVATRAPIMGLSADGSRVAFSTNATHTDCDHIAVWSPPAKVTLRFSPSLPAPCGAYNGGGMYGVELAGSRLAWTRVLGCGNFCEIALESATFAQPLPERLNFGGFEHGGEPWDYHAQGDGDLLVFNDGPRLVRLGSGSERCGGLGTGGICTTLRTGAHASAVDSVSGHLIAAREAGAVAVLDQQGTLVNVFPFAPSEVTAARLDGNRLLVARSGTLELYDVATGGGVLQRPLAAGYSLTDVDDSIAVLRHDKTIMLLRLADGHSVTLAPGRGPVLAALEPLGLYYSYATADGGGRLVFVPRSDLLRQLGQSNQKWEVTPAGSSSALPEAGARSSSHE